MIVCMVGAGVIIGLWRGALVQAELSPYKNLIGHAVKIHGVATEDPEIDKKGLKVIRLRVASIDGHVMSGQLWVTLSEKNEVKRSDSLVVKGVVEEGFGGFAAAMYRAKLLSVQRSVPGDVAGEVRDWFAKQVKKILPSEEAALGIGFLTGQNQTLSPELADAMKTAGLTHIVVASGYNLTILVRLTRRVFARISKYLAAASGAIMIGGFMAITGLSPSMSRAGLVAGLSLLAWYYGRKFHPLVLLPFAAAVTLLLTPSYGWNDLGWQLSFAAFAGVMVVAPLLQAYFFGNKKPGILRQILGETIAAQLMTLPILIGAFGQFSNVALLANILVVPLVPLAMLVTFLAGMMIIVWPWLAVIIGHLAEVILRYMISVTQALAGLPWAMTEIAVPGYVCVGLYGVIIGLSGYMWWATKCQLSSANLVE